MLGECFDPNAEFDIHEHCRPHWSQGGAVVFITFRTNDSIPREVLQRWEQEKQEWLRLRGLHAGQHWSAVLSDLSEPDRLDFYRQFNRTREDFLDTCHGACELKRPEVAKIVADSLQHFDGVRYRLGDYIIMPNHVHLLAVFPTAEAMHQQFDSWLHFTAVQINRLLQQKGKFWQQEPFDHLVRSPEQYDYLRKYIADNPIKARLKPGGYLYRRWNG